MSQEQGGTPPIYVAKYNRFVDNIISRVNRILRRSYDPVRVKLASNTKSTKRNRNKKKKKSTIARSSTDEKSHNEHLKASITSNETIANRQVTAVIGRAKQNKRKPVQKNKTKASKSQPKARATLFGLSSIKRDGDVTVNLMADHTTVRTNFALGPLTLKVEKEFGRGVKRELKSATATTAEMRGRLSLRVTNDGVSRLHSIKVLQPKQVRVDSADEHDSTREFVWRRSSHIAHLVSQKLASATRSMLRPPVQSKKPAPARS